MTKINPKVSDEALLIGHRVVCLKPVSFCDGSSHKEGDAFTVEPETLAYFRLFSAGVYGEQKLYSRLNR